MTETDETPKLAGRLDGLVMPAARKYFDFRLDYIQITG